MDNPAERAEDFDPGSFIDREAEQELFGGLLKFEDDARLLAIQDGSGKGKSTLLRRLEYNCQWQFNCPVALISLDQLTEPSAFGLVEAIRKRLQDRALTFANYNAVNMARVNRNGDYLTQFAAAGARPVTAVQGTLNAQNATITGSGMFAGTIEKVIQHADTVITGTKEWTPEQETAAREQCVTAFFEDLKTICKAVPVTLLFDAWEGCNSALKPWIRNTLLRTYCFDLDQRPPKLLLVLAGREPVMDFKTVLGQQRCARLVRSISSLGAWEIEHVKQFLAINHVVGIDDSDAEYVCRKLNANWTLLQALNFVRQYLRDEAKAS